MEKLSAKNDLQIQGVMVPLDAGWSDVGAWEAVWSIAAKDSEGNAVSGDVILENSRNSLIFATSRLVSCVGIDHLVVVETPDAVLVADAHHVQDVKKIVTELKARKRKECTDHRKVHKPWGWYDILETGERFQVKRIVVNPGGILSLQSHPHRGEYWVIVRGTANVTCGEENYLLSENQSTHIPLGTKLRIENPGDLPLEVIEVQYGSYLSEDDIFRFEDIYGRHREGT
jgi:mannose-1-phosphate guanylyltransferase/mannose-6-phosphate isomerase